MRVIIAGGRDFKDMPYLVTSMDSVSRDLQESQLTIVSGGARGADSCGEKYAKANCFHIHRYPAHWDKLGKSAGYIRNHIMADNADVLVAFHDGVSRGTQHMIDIANKKGLKVYIFPYSNVEA